MPNRRRTRIYSSRISKYTRSHHFSHATITAWLYSSTRKSTSKAVEISWSPKTCIKTWHRIGIDKQQTLLRMCMAIMSICIRHLNRHCMIRSSWLSIKCNLHLTTIWNTSMNTQQLPNGNSHRLPRLRNMPVILQSSLLSSPTPNWCNISEVHLINPTIMKDPCTIPRNSTQNNRSKLPKVSMNILTNSINLLLIPWGLNKTKQNLLAIDGIWTYKLAITNNTIKVIRLRITIIFSWSHNCSRAM